MFRRIDPAIQSRVFGKFKPQEYKSERVMNWGMQAAQSQFRIFSNADATPQGPDWLRPLRRRCSIRKWRRFWTPDSASRLPGVYACDYERCFG